MATLLALTGDLHIGSTVALCPKAVDLDDGGQYRASKMQGWIYERWTDYWNLAREWQDQYDAEIVTILNGELMDDLRHPSTQIWSRNKNDLGRAAIEALDVCRELSDRIYVTRGSEAHSGLSGALDESMARAIGATSDENGQYARWHFRGEIGGLKLDVAHHPGTGHGRPWTRGADANRVAAIIKDEYTEIGMPLPDLVVRGHNHKPSDSYDNHCLRAVILPSWQLTNAFGYRLGGGWLPIGGMLALVENGEIIREKKIFAKWPISDWSAA